MMCSIIKIMASHALDNNRPLPNIVRKHAAHCEKCRIFVETVEKLEILLPPDAREITIPEGLQTGSTLTFRPRTTPILIAAAAIIAILLGSITLKNKSSLSIENLSRESTIAINEVLDNQNLAGIMTAGVLQKEMDALIQDSQTVINSLRSFADLTP